MNLYGVVVRRFPRASKSNNNHNRLAPFAKALELLAVLMVDGPEGYRAVLAAMDYFKLVKGERVRFYSLLDALMTDEADLAFKRDVMLFINTLVNRWVGGGVCMYVHGWHK